MPSLTAIISGSIALILLIGAGVTAMPVAEFYFAAKRSSNQVVLLNHAKETISQGEVHAFGQGYRFQTLAVGETAQITTSARGEGGYVVDVLFQSGRTLSSDELGYLTYGFMISDLIEIQNDKIILVNREIKKR